MACNECKYYDENVDGDALGYCRIRAPHLQCRDFTLVNSMWPIVRGADDWCGEFEKIVGPNTNSAGDPE